MIPNEAGPETTPGPDLDASEWSEILAAIQDDEIDFGDIGLDAPDLDLAAFGLAPVTPKIATRYVKPPLYVGERRSVLRYDNAVKLARDIGTGVLDGDSYFVWVSGNFIFGDFIEAFAVETNSLIDDLTISTLAISRDNVDSLHNLLAGDYLGALNLIVSDYWYSHSRANLPYIYEQLDIDDKFQLAVAGVHTKITTMRIGDRKIVMHGSANLRSSRRLEAFHVGTDPVVYDSCAEVHGIILEHYATVRKSVRANALFTLIGGDDHV